MKKKLFITGGAGFIGSAIINDFVKNGDEVFVYDNLSFGNRKFAGVGDSHFLCADILDCKSLNTALLDFQPDYVIHLAAIHFIPYCNLHPFQSANVNIKGTINLLDACKKSANPEKIFFASTAAVYPFADGSLSEPINPQPSDIYGLSKLAGEELCKKFYAETSIPTIICRFFNAFGPNETNDHLIPAIQKQVVTGNRTIKVGNTVPKRDYIHTHDMSAAVQLLLRKFETGIEIFNLGRGEEYSVVEVINAFEKALGEPLQYETDPGKVRKTDRLHLLADINKLKEYTGWRPLISLEQGIKTLLA